MLLRTKGLGVQGKKVIIWFFYLIMNCLQSFNLTTFNMHGIKNGAGMLNDLCNNNDIIAVQELW